MKFKLALFLTITLLSSNSWSTLEDFDYYPDSIIDLSSSKESTDKEIKSELFKVLSLYHKKTKSRDQILESCNEKCFIQKKGISYKTARIELFGNLHIKKSSSGRYTVKDLYCEKEYGEANGVGPGKIPSGSVINCEHTWPQSRFNPLMSKSLQKTDLHHLYPVSNRANSSRSNHIFAEVNGTYINSQCKSSKRGMAYGSSITAFEPPTHHKGNVARALFYFSVRYKIQIDPLEERYLRNWHVEDPVDQEEKIRNQKIFEFQKNRNPFIDAPELVDNISDF
jgi:deoxyribonuclease-1